MGRRQKVEEHITRQYKIDEQRQSIKVLHKSVEEAQRRADYHYKAFEGQAPTKSHQERKRLPPEERHLSTVQTA